MGDSESASSSSSLLFHCISYAHAYADDMSPMHLQEEQLAPSHIDRNEHIPCSTMQFESPNLLRQFRNHYIYQTCIQCPHQTHTQSSSPSRNIFQKAQQESLIHRTLPIAPVPHLARTQSTRTIRLRAIRRLRHRRNHNTRCSRVANTRDPTP